MRIAYILSVEGDKSFTRPIYAGNANATVESEDAKLVLTVRGTAFEKAAATGGSGTVEAVSAGGDAGLSSFVGSEIAKSERPELTSARSEEHTSELQSLMRISYAVFCLKKKTLTQPTSLHN